MQNYRIELLPKAQRDIAGILDYIALDLCNPSAALHLLDKITEQFDRLKSFPLCGELVKTDSMPLKYAYRRVMADNYLIFYTVNEEKKAVTVAHVVYGSSNYLSIL